MTEPTRPPSSLSARAQAILDRAERDARALAGGDAPFPSRAAADEPLAAPPVSGRDRQGLARPAALYDTAAPAGTPTRPGTAAAAPAALPYPSSSRIVPSDRVAPSDPAVDHLLALVNALAQRTEAARRQLAELTTALEALTLGLSESGTSPPAGPAPPIPSRRRYDPAPPPAVRWPGDPREGRDDRRRTPGDMR